MKLVNLKVVVLVAASSSVASVKVATSSIIFPRRCRLAMQIHKDGNRYKYGQPAARSSGQTSDNDSL